MWPACQLLNVTPDLTPLQYRSLVFLKGIRKKATLQTDYSVTELLWGRRTATVDQCRLNNSYCTFCSMGVEGRQQWISAD